MNSTTKRKVVGGKGALDKQPATLDELTAGKSGFESGHRLLRTAPTKGRALLHEFFPTNGRSEAAPNLYRMPDVEFIANFRAGIESTFVTLIAEHMGTTRKCLQDYLQLSSTTIERKKNKSVNLDIYQFERLAGLKRLIDQVQAMVEDSGDPTGFDAAEWLGRWIEKPLPALGGKKPADYLSTVSGQKLLSNLLNQMQSGAYA